jgi:hypothetical protein
VVCNQVGTALITAPGSPQGELSTLADMAADPQTDPSAEKAADEESFVAAYDLDGDGEVSAVEDAKAVLGLADARLEQIADEGGAKGKIAGAAHKLVDKLDND